MDPVESQRPDAQPPRALTPDERAMVDNVMRQCLAVAADDRVVIVTDPPKLSIGELFYAGALRHSREVTLLVMPVAERHGSEPPPAVAEAHAHGGGVRAADVNVAHPHARPHGGDGRGRQGGEHAVDHL